MLERSLSKQLEEALSDTPAVIVIGPRQAGKSTFVNRYAEGRNYITLDDPLELERAKRNPGEFLDTHSTPLTLDEVQRAPELMLPLKLRIDKNRKAGNYLLTGSANVLSLPKVADTLAGRIEVIELLPLTQAEIGGHVSSPFIESIFSEEGPEDKVSAPDDLPMRLLRGGFPEPAARATPSRRQAWFTSYLRTLVERDVRDLANIEGLVQVPRLLTLLAARTGTVLNVTSLSRETNIPATTLTRYLELLKSLFLLQTVPAWSFDSDVRLIKTPKTFIVDSSLVGNLLRVDEKRLETDEEMLSQLTKNFVANELAKLISQSEMKPWLMHLRTVRQKEVEFVLENPDGQIVGIEVTTRRNLTAEDTEGLQYLEELAAERFMRGVVLYRGDRIKRLGPKMIGVPISSLWTP